MASKAVNRPTDVKVKEKDIESKLQLYGIYTAFANGKNKQIDVAMNSALASQVLRPGQKLSPEGQHTLTDLRNVIEQAKTLLLTKNEGNLLQDFIWQTSHASRNDLSNGPNAPISKETAKGHGNDALDGLRTLGELVITNGEFRKLLKDSTIILRDIAGDAAQKSADKVKPSQEDLDQIDQHEEDNTWYEKPDLSTDRLRNEARSRMPIGKQDARGLANDASEQQNQGVDARQTAGNVKNKLSDRMDEEQKQKLREQRERGRNYLEGKMPQERRDQVIYRLKKMVVEIQQHSDYQQAIDSLLTLAEEYGGHARNMGQQSKSAAKDTAGRDHLQLAKTDLKTVLERFANHTSFDDLIDSIDQIYRDAQRDPELKDWFKSVDKYVRRCLQESGYILKDQANEEWNRLYDHGHYLTREKYHDHFDRVSDEANALGNEFDRDSQNKAFADSLQKLFKNFGTDMSSNTHLLNDLTHVILPGLFERTQYFPIPRIEYSDPMVDAIIENLVVESDNLIPNVVELGSNNKFSWGRRSNNAGRYNHNDVMIAASGIQMDLRDVSYYIKKKQGFPSVTDKGVMDIFLGGTGASFRLALETADKSDKAHFFKVKNVHVEIKNMDIRLKQSNHKLLFKLFKPLLFKIISPVIQKVAEKQIRDQVTDLDNKCYLAKKEGDIAAAEASRSEDPEAEQVNIYQRYFTAFQKQIGKHPSQQVEKGTSDAKTNIAMTQHDSIFPNISLPGGVSTKATKYKEMAQQGEKWQSPVFGIGSAGESRNLPGAQKVRRKGKGAEAAAAGGAVAAAGAGGAAAYGATRHPEQNGTLDPVSRELETRPAANATTNAATTTTPTKDPVALGDSWSPRPDSGKSSGHYSDHLHNHHPSVTGFEEEVKGAFHMGDDEEVFHDSQQLKEGHLNYQGEHDTTLGAANAVWKGEA